MKTGKVSCRVDAAAWRMCLLALVPTTAIACSQPVTDGETENVATNGAGDENVLAALSVGDTVVRFQKIDDEGAVGMLEDAPLTARSVLDTLVGEEHATPLEVFRALASPGARVPEALVDNHRLATGGAEPRSLSTGAESGLQPQGQSVMNVGAADCSFASDGQSFFDGVWQALGWDWHWYVYHSAYKSLGWVGSATTNVTANYRAHVCNGGKASSPLTNLPFSVARQPGGACESKVLVDAYNVKKDRRAIWYQTNAPACQYRAWAMPQGTVGYPMRWSMGIMAP